MRPYTYNKLRLHGQDIPARVDQQQADGWEIDPECWEWARYLANPLNHEIYILTFRRLTAEVKEEQVKLSNEIIAKKAQ
jgi:hypothetical protein